MDTTKASAYALLAVSYLGRRWKGRPISVKELSTAQGISKSFLHKILTQLENQSYVRSQKGARGGFVLRRPVEEISVLEIIEAIQGPMFFQKCLLGKPECNAEDGCAVHNIWQSAQQRMKQTLETATIASISVEATSESLDMTTGTYQPNSDAPVALRSE